MQHLRRIFMRLFQDLKLRLYPKIKFLRLYFHDCFQIDTCLVLRNYVRLILYLSCFRAIVFALFVSSPFSTRRDDYWPASTKDSLIFLLRFSLISAPF